MAYPERPTLSGLSRWLWQNSTSYRTFIQLRASSAIPVVARLSGNDWAGNIRAMARDDK